MLAGIDRLLPPLCARLAAAGRGARRVRLTLVRTDGRREVREVGLARPADRPEAIRPLLALQLGEIDAGFGIEVMRLEATGGRAAEPAPAPRPARRRGAAAGRPATRPRPRRPPRPARRPARARGADPPASRPTATSRRRARPRWRPPSPRRPRRWPPPAAPRPILIFPPEPLDAARTPAAARGLRLAPAAAPARRRLRAGADRPGMVARRPGLALRAARLLAGRDRGGRRGSGSSRPRAARCPRGWFAQGLFA